MVVQVFFPILGATWSAALRTAEHSRQGFNNGKMDQAWLVYGKLLEPIRSTLVIQQFAACYGKWMTMARL